MENELKMGIYFFLYLFKKALSIKDVFNFHEQTFIRKTLNEKKIIKSINKKFSTKKKNFISKNLKKKFNKKMSAAKKNLKKNLDN